MLSRCKIALEFAEGVKAFYGWLYDVLVYMGVMMMHKRYGKIKWSDNKITIFVWVILVIMGLIPTDNEYLSIIPFVILIIHFFTFIYPFTERFVIKDKTLHIKKLFSSSQKTIPQKSMLVITEASIHISSNSTSIPLRGKYAITLTEYMPTDELLQKVRGVQPFQISYCNSTIENALKHRVIYSFIYNETVLETLLECSDCVVIIPESIVRNFDTSRFKDKLYVDAGWYKKSYSSKIDF